MKSIKSILLLFTILCSFQAFCQNDKTVEMADVLRRDGKIYTVVISLVVILTGLVLFLLRVDKKVSVLKDEIEKRM